MTVIIGKVGGEDWVGTNDCGVGRLLFKLQDSERVSDDINRLTEENAKLREFVKKVSELDIETFRFETQGGDEDYIEYVCTDIVDDAVDLLAKLNQEGEE